jgi:hypothetical protein
MAIQPLSGVEILCPDLTVRSFGGRTEEFRYTAERAARLGATIVRDEAGDIAFHREHLMKPNTFTVLGSSSLITHVAAEIHERSLVTQPLKKEYVHAWADRLELPFLFAAHGHKGATGKYLIETTDQLATVQRLVESNPLQLGLAGTFEVQEWVPTPSEYYTSYQIVTAPTGHVLAAGLAYSTHTEKQAKRLVATKSNNDSPATPLTVLEDPKSAYFIHARDTRANAKRGDQCIPLMGNSNRHITRAEKRILQAHGIDPKDRNLPKDVYRQATIAAQTIGRVSGLAVNYTFLQHEQTGEAYFLEANAAGGTVAWSECWHKGEVIPSEVARKQMADGSLTAIISDRFPDTAQQTAPYDFYRFLTNGNIAHISIFLRD